MALKFANILGKLAEVASKSEIAHKHGAVVLASGDPIVWGYNSIKGQNTYHAECEAIRKYINMYGISNPHKLGRNLRNITILVVRWNGNKFVNSKPCKHCIIYMKNLGIKKIYYSDDCGDIIKAKIKELKNEHTCMARRIFGEYI